MKPSTAGGSSHRHQFAGLVVQGGVAPLLQFDDDVRRRTGLWVPPREYDVGTLAGQRKAVFEHHLYVAQPGIEQVLRQNRQTA